ncbi:aminomethyltransferase family protein [Paracoccus sp. MC1862]|uniref:aminomethyltransferase family protein n=1 Tax=Paracoccus sp. MC1862 TaxID=2760307 RepID=UPI0016041B1F|nr:aminomethyltransferase family protein [Paracoccus sp. MC1862]MBB1499439.1 aminomethyl transferase family protein [Paracoccus sp. MC1862]QQO43558.1 aminomethyltransferase family protein [Paracoccus sp. MC1862]
MTNSWRISTLADRHRALGSKLEDWNGMPTAWTYDKPMIDDYTAIRTKAGLMDVSGLKKVHVTGPAATQVIERATTRNMAKLMPGRAVYACMLNDAGKFIDDCVIYRQGPNNYLVVHGTGLGTEQLTTAGAGRNVAVLFDDNMHDLSLQGPLAVDFLEKHVAGIRNLAYFGHIQTSLFGKPVMISRTGYTGERGYEIFCKGEDAPEIWDRILEEGKEMGIVPVQFGTLDLLRTESYLLFYPGDNSETFPFDDDSTGDTLWELGLDFTVSPNFTGFRGAEEHARLKGKERFKIWGLKLDGDSQPDNGAEVHDGGRRIGVVTQGLASPVNDYTVAIARLPVDYATDGKTVTVRTANGDVSATTHSMPFYDVEKKRRTAKG